MRRIEIECIVDLIKSLDILLLLHLEDALEQPRLLVVETKVYGFFELFQAFLFLCSQEMQYGHAAAKILERAFVILRSHLDGEDVEVGLIVEVIEGDWGSFRIAHGTLK